MGASKKHDFVFIIPARANSVRLPGKNRRHFCGKPLICWSIEAAMGTSSAAEIVVTTDDLEILNLKSLYPSVSFIHRPEALSTSDASSLEVVEHAVKAVNSSAKAIVLLQPTSPLRTTHHIDSAIEIFIRSGGDRQVVSVCKVPGNQSHFVVNNEGGVRLLSDVIKGELYSLNGAIYISPIEVIREFRTFMSKDVVLFEMDLKLSVDIDTQEDWDNALSIFQESSGGNV